MKDLRHALSFLSVAAIAAVPGTALAQPGTPTPRLACYTQLKDGRIIDLSAMCRTQRRSDRVPGTLEQAAVEGARERKRLTAELLSRPTIDPVDELLETVPRLWR